MKHLSLFILALATLSGTAHATSERCYKFINGKGPASIGEGRFSDPAKSLCVGSVHSVMGGSHLQIKFLDEQGLIAGFDVTDAQESRMLDGTDAVYTINDAPYVNDIKVTIQGNRPSGGPEVETGVISITAPNGGVAKFLYITN